MHGIECNPISFRGYPARRQAYRGFIANSLYEFSGTRLSEFVEQEFDNFARCHMEKVFIGEDTYKDPFSKDIAYEIQDPLLSALIAVSKERQHNGFFVTVLHRHAPDSEAYLKHKYQYHWYVPFSDIHQYRDLVGPLENVVYAEDGSWGVMISYGWHSFLGCDEDVYRELLDYLPDLDNQVRNFLKHIKSTEQFEGPYDEWLPALLESVYGEELERELLDEADLCS